jgi:uncharacterized protein
VARIEEIQDFSAPMKLQLFCCAALLLLTACDSGAFPSGNRSSKINLSTAVAEPKLVEISDPMVRKLVAGGTAQTEVTKTYDPAYVRLAYPGGDVDKSTGVCTDVIIRAYRELGIDLQKLVHEDMTRNFGSYPKLWGLQQPDKNIDHRRVANLMTFFDRQQAALPIGKNPADYQPGDLVTYDLGPSIGLHIAMVTNIPGPNGYKMVHNACCGTKIETLPTSWKINGHYRYLPKRASR